MYVSHARKTNIVFTSKKTQPESFPVCRQKNVMLGKNLIGTTLPV
jgi:hypothetical protein